MSRQRVLPAAAALAVVLSGAAALAITVPPQDTRVERQKAKILRLSTQMGEEVLAYLYYPPGARPVETGPPPYESGPLSRQPSKPEATSPAALASPTASPTAGMAPAAGPVAGAAGGPQASERPLPLLFFSGEWGWTPMLQDTASYLALRGRYVLGVDSTSYFRKIIDHAGMERDLRTFRARVNEAAGNPQDSSVLLGGYAFGATLIPYVLNLGGAQGFHGAFLIGPGDAGAAVYRVAIQLKIAVPSEETFSVPDEVRRLPPIPAVVLEGSQDVMAKGRTLLPLFKGQHKYVPIAGTDRHFGEDRLTYYEAVAASLVWLDRQSDWVDSGLPAAPLRPVGPGQAMPGAIGPGIGGRPLPLPRPTASPTPGPR